MAEPGPWAMRNPRFLLSRGQYVCPASLFSNYFMRGIFAWSLHLGTAYH